MIVFTVLGGEELQKVVQGTRVIVDQLAPFTNYSFYVRAYNARSTSHPSAVVMALTEEDGWSTVAVLSFSLFSVCPFHISRFGET